MESRVFVDKVVIKDDIQILLTVNKSQVDANELAKLQGTTVSCHLVAEQTEMEFADPYDKKVYMCIDCSIDISEAERNATRMIHGKDLCERCSVRRSDEIKERERLGEQAALRCANCASSNVEPTVEGNLEEIICKSCETVGAPLQCPECKDTRILFDTDNPNLLTCVGCGIQWLLKVPEPVEEGESPAEEADDAEPASDNLFDGAVSDFVEESADETASAPTVEVEESERPETPSDAETAVETPAEGIKPPSMLPLEVMEECCKILKGIQDYPFDVKVDADFLDTLAFRYQDVSMLKALTEWAEWLVKSPLFAPETAREELEGMMQARSKRAQ